MRNERPQKHPQAPTPEQPLTLEKGLQTRRARKNRTRDAEAEAKAPEATATPEGDTPETTGGGPTSKPEEARDPEKVALSSFPLDAVSDTASEGPRREDTYTKHWGNAPARRKCGSQQNKLINYK